MTATPKPTIVARKATIADAGALAAIERAAFDATRYDGLITKARFVHFARSPLSGANAELVVAEAARTVVGYALVLFRKGSTAGRFYSLAVDPSMQGAGAGSVLFAAAEQAVRDRGASRMRLEIREDNKVLLDRYGRMGYAKVQRVPGYYPDGCAALRMERRL